MGRALVLCPPWTWRPVMSVLPWYFTHPSPQEWGWRSPTPRRRTALTPSQSQWTLKNIFFHMTKMLTPLFRILGCIITIGYSRSCINIELSWCAVYFTKSSNMAHPFSRKFPFIILMKREKYHSLYLWNSAVVKHLL